MQQSVTQAAAKSAFFIGGGVKGFGCLSRFRGERHEAVANLQVSRLLPRTERRTARCRNYTPRATGWQVSRTWDGQDVAGSAGFTIS